MGRESGKKNREEELYGPIHQNKFKKEPKSAFGCGKSTWKVQWLLWRRRWNVWNVTRMNLLLPVSVDHFFGSHVFAVFAPVLGLMAVSKVSTKSLQKVWEGPCWERMWPFLDPWHVVEMCTTASSWNTIFRKMNTEMRGADLIVFRIN